jgi:hypothetical protein
LDDGTSRRLDIGTVAPATPAFYVRAQGDGRIGLLREHEADNFFRKETDSWRKPHLFQFKPAAVTELVLKSSGRRVVVTKDSTGAWSVGDPFPGLADRKAVEDFLKGLAAARARSFPDDDPSGLERYGLDRPDGSVAVRDTSGRVHHLWLGKTYRGMTGAERYALTSGRPNVFGVPEAYLGLARRSDLTFRDRHILRTGMRNLMSLLLATDGDTVQIKPDSNGVWRAVGEKGTPGAPPPDRSAFAEGWLSVQADSVLPAAGPLAERVDWEPPVLIVEAREATGLERLEVGRWVDSPPAEDLNPVRLVISEPSRQGEVFLIQADAARSALALLREVE